MPLERADADLSARRMVGGPPTRGRRTRSGGEVSEAASRLVGQQSGTETAVERSRLGVLDLVLPLPFPHTPPSTRILIPRCRRYSHAAPLITRTAEPVGTTTRSNHRASRGSKYKEPVESGCRWYSLSQGGFVDGIGGGCGWVCHRIYAAFAPFGKSSSVYPSRQQIDRLAVFIPDLVTTIYPRVCACQLPAC